MLSVKKSKSELRVKNGPKKPCNPKQQQRCIRATPRYCGIKNICWQLGPTQSLTQTHKTYRIQTESQKIQTRIEFTIITVMIVVVFSVFYANVHRYCHRIHSINVPGVFNLYWTKNLARFSEIQSYLEIQIPYWKSYRKDWNLSVPFFRSNWQYFSVKFSLSVITCPLKPVAIIFNTPYMDSFAIHIEWIDE